jgi:hypothetical protein
MTPRILHSFVHGRKHPSVALLMTDMASMKFRPSRHVIIVGCNIGGIACATRPGRLNEHCPITVIETGSDLDDPSCYLPYVLHETISDDAPLRSAIFQKLQEQYRLGIKTMHRVMLALLSGTMEKLTIACRNLTVIMWPRSLWSVLVAIDGFAAFAFLAAASS